MSASGGLLGSFWLRMPKAVRRRIVFLVSADALLLAFIWSRAAASGASFGDEMGRLVPNVAPTVLAALGQTGIICCGAMDLSVGSILAVAGTVFGVLHARGVAPAGCFAACFFTAFGLSAYNGLLIRVLRIPAIIVTLAGLAFYRGLALIVAEVASRGFGEQFTLTAEAYHRPGQVYAGWILLAALAVALWGECFAKTPRTWLALGNSEAACRLSGLDPARIQFGAFLVGGIFLGLASLLDVTNHITIEPARLGAGFELSVIAANVLGGTSIFGGQGSAAGTALGGLFLYLLGPAMLYAGVDEYWRTAVQGAAILAVIGIDCALGRRRKLMEELR
ncbi:MAG TPA: ABC transporter permease [Planctomycetaceae bacterium]|jgi:ribose transport system permease protein|nr:ABC transporter permease [Planctomycetaceae bacterium]